VEITPELKKHWRSTMASRYISKTVSLPVELLNVLEELKEKRKDPTFSDTPPCHSTYSDST
jgi:hypothetical protein